MNVASILLGVMVGNRSAREIARTHSVFHDPDWKPRKSHGAVKPERASRRARRRARGRAKAARYVLYSRARGLACNDAYARAAIERVTAGVKG